MIVHVLGSAAGGGFPQWNCNCRNCDGLRQGRINARARTQSSIAVSADGGNWVLCNASPDILAQLRGFPPLQPARAVRDTAIVGVVLVDSQIDHTTGLLMLREGKPLRVYATDSVREDLTTGNPVFKLLEHYCGIDWQRMGTGPEAGFRIDGVSGLQFRALALVSKAPPYSPHRQQPREGDNVGILVRDEASGRTLFYAPGLGAFEPQLAPIFATADCLLVDGTFWSDDEMIRLQISGKRAQEMGHLALSGPGGMIEVLGAYPHPRKVLIHINNTNPILDEDSRERAELAAAGIEVAHDGMDIVL
ncbi:MAG TPA: pyrroloquinoline quinone biosynthesis protein PqqB [Casimicrobiaceae bacterium]|nr:pyrroloquinoline quinone biosynthesis protein PqqB [Casimicrobiaceae bacterium]